jgi:hypothetical protein
MRKIKITESQAKRLKLINENADELARFEHFCKIKVDEINKVYTKVTNISVAEILNHEVNMVEINNILEKIDNELYIGNKKAYESINNLPESDLDVRIDKAYDKVHNKLTPLQIIVLDLEKLQLAAEQHDLTGPFNDVKPIDISSTNL